MIEYFNTFVKNNLFLEDLSDESEDNIVDNYQNYTLVINDLGNNTFLYKIYDPNGVLLDKLSWKHNVDALSLSISDYKRSTVKSMFMRKVYSDIDSKYKEKNKQAVSEKPYYNYSGKTANPNYLSMYDNPFKEDNSIDTELVEKLSKSDTLVIHCEDKSTKMLSQVYEGKNWDVLTNGNINKATLHELLKNHKRIVMLGHGTASGLINVQKGGYIIGDSEAPYLKDKKLFVIWCNADKYFDYHHIGDGQFITGNMPSEVWECKAAGCGDISSELMLENITYWSKLCADVVEKALSGDAQGAVDYVRKHYLEKYGDHLVSIYNAERTKVQGKPLEDLSHMYTGDFSEKPQVSYQNKTKNDPKTSAAQKDNNLNDTKYRVNPDISYQISTSDMRSYIDHIEGLIDDFIGLDEIEYWMDFEDEDEDTPLIQVKYKDGGIEYFEICWDRIRSWG